MRERKKKTNRQKSYGQESVGRSRATAAPAFHTHKWLGVFATNLRQARRRRQLSVQQLARKTKFSADFVRKAERGALPKLDLVSIETFATALAVDFTDLTKGCGRPGGA
jgi:ribosome-binding protein aMBF1 (putative translation factor)